MMNDLVSVVIPVYNVKDYIAESIKSICIQSYDNIEIILVDDGTKDNSIEIALKVIEQYKRPVKIVHQNNSGLPSARNTGLKYADGDYVCFIDADDVICKDHIYNLANMVAHNSLLVAFSDYECTSVNLRNGCCNAYSGNYVYTKNQLFHFFMKRKPAIHCCSLIINTELTKKTLFNEHLKYGEDVDFMWRLFSNVDRIGHVKKKTYKYLIRDNSIMTTIDLERGLVLKKEFANTIIKLCQAYPIYSNIYVYVYYRTMLGWINSVAKSSDYITFTKCIKSVPIEKMIKALSTFPDMRVRAMVTILYYNKRAFYEIVNRRK